MTTEENEINHVIQRTVTSSCISKLVIVTGIVTKSSNIRVELKIAQ